MGCLLYPPGHAGTEAVFPQRTAEDLQLERLAEAMAFSAYYKLSARELCALFTDDPAVLRWRQEVFRDVLEQPELEGAMERLLDSLDGWESKGGSRRNADAFAMGFSLEEFSWLDGYLRKIDSAWQDLSRIPTRSRGFQALGNLLEELRSSPRFRDAQQDFRDLCPGYAAPARMRLGYNLDGELKPSRLKLLHLAPWNGDEGRQKTGKNAMLLSQQALEMNGMLLQRVSRQAAQDIASFVLRETAPLRGLRRDLIVCLSMAKLCRSWAEAGLPACFPTLLPTGEKAFSARGLFDPLLLLSGKETVVSNDIDLRPGGELLLLTGANQGGKTVFLMSVGLCQWLGQLGFPVPAGEASLSPAENILTVFAPNGQRYGRKCLLAEEAGRIAEAVSALGRSSLVLFNEPLTGTGPEETKSISAEVIAVCMAAGARGVWVTHVYELASRRAALEEAVPWGSRLGSLRIVLDTAGGETRFTYRVERGEPLGDSRAEEALRRGGVEL